MLKNVCTLLKTMKMIGIKHTAFDFSFNAVHTVVLFSDASAFEDAPHEAIAIITFINKCDISNCLNANSNGSGLNFVGGIKAFRTFYHIRYSDNLGDIAKQFMVYFDNKTPEHPQKPLPETRKLIGSYLEKKDPEDPDAVYLIGVKHNGRTKSGKQMQRSEFNSEKTQLLYPEIFRYFKDKPEISFCYSADPEREASGADAILRLGGSS